jgi:hypothetical protein
MSEALQPNPATYNLLSAEHTEEFEKVVTEVRRLDPELLAYPDTRQLITLGARAIGEVTQQYGTPDAPEWASGTHETDVLMVYHNGGEDGHTSVGPRGSGVPRNTLIIAQAVNTSAGREVYSPLMRAVSFYGGAEHDIRQLCGRALSPEGQGEGRGDERLSAEDARDRYLAAGGSPAVAQRTYNATLATAFNPETQTQNVDREAWHANFDDPELAQTVLEQELTVTADLFGSTGPRGPLNSIEYSVESLCLVQKGRTIQEQLRADGIPPASITTIEQLLGFIAQNKVLRSLFAKTVGENAKFTSDYLRYPDEAIRTACGSGIDDLFPGRLQNGATLADYAEALRDGEDPHSIWQQARAHAGYGSQRHQGR